jgi:hypothetical protein
VVVIRRERERKDRLIYLLRRTRYITAGRHGETRLGTYTRRIVNRYSAVVVFPRRRRVDYCTVTRFTGFASE